MQEKEYNLPVKYDDLEISEKRVVREQYIKQQNGFCCHCFKSLSESPPKEILEKRITKTLFPPNFFKFPVHLHHDHKTGYTIGAIHNYCNAVLWEHFGE